MSENLDNLIIEHLKGLRVELREMRTLNTEEHNDLKARLSHLEAELLSIK